MYYIEDPSASAYKYLRIYKQPLKADFYMKMRLDFCYSLSRCRIVLHWLLRKEFCGCGHPTKNLRICYFKE